MRSFLLFSFFLKQDRVLFQVSFDSGIATMPTFVFLFSVWVCWVFVADAAVLVLFFCFLLGFFVVVVLVIVLEFFWGGGGIVFPVQRTKLRDLSMVVVLVTFD